MLIYNQLNDRLVSVRFDGVKHLPAGEGVYEPGIMFADVIKVKDQARGRGGWVVQNGVHKDSVHRLLRVSSVKKYTMVRQDEGRSGCLVPIIMILHQNLGNDIGNRLRFPQTFGGF